MRRRQMFARARIGQPEGMPPLVHVRHFTDPACPFAYSAEPVRQQLRYLFDDQLAWEDRMVVLSRDPSELEAKGLTLETMAGHFASFEAQYGMPFDTRVRPRHAASEPACRAVVAARVRAPGHEAALLRRLRVLAMGGGVLDDPELIHRAAAEAGLDPFALARWMGEDAVGAALADDAALARDPEPAAVALSHKLAAEGAGWRYTCPSYELRRADDGRTITVPGFQPWAAYEVALANLAPELRRRERPDSVEAALDWAAEPLAAAEVAALCGISRDEARAALAAFAVERPVGEGGEGWWIPREGVRERPLAPVHAAA